MTLDSLICKYCVLWCCTPIHLCLKFCRSKVFLSFKQCSCCIYKLSRVRAIMQTFRSKLRGGSTNPNAYNQFLMTAERNRGRMYCQMPSEFIRLAQLTVFPSHPLARTHTHTHTHLVHWWAGPPEPLRPLWRSLPVSYWESEEGGSYRRGRTHFTAWTPHAMSLPSLPTCITHAVNPKYYKTFLSQINPVYICLHQECTKTEPGYTRPVRVAVRERWTAGESQLCLFGVGLVKTAMYGQKKCLRARFTHERRGWVYSLSHS